jgi:hypothetical protein
MKTAGDRLSLAGGFLLLALCLRLLTDDLMWMAELGRWRMSIFPFVFKHAHLYQALIPAAFIFLWPKRRRLCFAAALLAGAAGSASISYRTWQTWMAMGQPGEQDIVGSGIIRALLAAGSFAAAMALVWLFQNLREKRKA